MKDPVCEQRLDKIDFMGNGTFNHVAARRAVAVDQQHNLGALNTFSLACAMHLFLQTKTSRWPWTLPGRFLPATPQKQGLPTGQKQTPKNRKQIENK